MVRRRRFGRRRFGRRRRVPRVRKARMILKRQRFKRNKKFARKRRAKQYLYCYDFGNHVDAKAGETIVQAMDVPTGGGTLQRLGLFRVDDAMEILQQVKNIDDLIYPSMSVQGIKAGRQNIKVRAKGVYSATISNTTTAGVCFLEIYVCKPRMAITAQGVGVGPNTVASDVINNNRNNAFVTDYNDASGITLGATPFPINNATDQTKPSILVSDKCYTPYLNPVFTKNWKVLKQYKYTLPPSACCMVRVKSSATFTHQTYGLRTAVGSNSIDLPSFGRDIFIRIHGQPVHDTTTHTNVNYAPATVDIVGTKKYWYSHSARPNPSYLLGTISNIGTVTASKLNAEPPQTVAEE